MADIKGNQKIVFDALKGMGYSGIGESADEFGELMKDSANRRTVHNALTQGGFTGIGNDFNEFEGLIYDRAGSVSPTPKDAFMQRMQDPLGLKAMRQKEMQVRSDMQARGVELPEEKSSAPAQPVSGYQNPYGDTPLSKAHQYIQETARMHAQSSEDPEITPNANNKPYKPTWQEQWAYGITANNAENAAERVKNSVDKNLEQMSNTSLTGDFSSPVGVSSNLRRGERKFNAETGQFEDTYVTQLGHEYKSLYDADQEQKQLDEYSGYMSKLNKYRKNMQELGLDDITGESEKDINQRIVEAEEELADIEERIEKERIGQIGRLARNSLAYGHGLDAQDKANADRQDDLLVSQRLVQRRLDAMKAYRDDKGLVGGTIDELSDPRTWGFGFLDAADAIQLSKLSGKISAAEEKGETPNLSPSERILARQYLMNQEAQTLNKDNWWYGAGQGLGQTLSFMKDFVVTGGGFAKLATGGMALGSKIGAKAATKLLGDYMTKNLGTKVLGKTILYGGKAAGLAAGAEAGGFLQSNTIQLPKTLANIAERHTGTLSVGDDGMLTFKGGEDIAKSVIFEELKATGENGSELVGLGFDALPKILGRVISRTTTGQVLKRFTANKIWQGGEKTINFLGVQSLWGEGMEEEYNMGRNALLNYITGNAYDPNAESITDLGAHLNTWATVGITSVALRVPQMAISGYQTANYYGYKYNLNQSDNRLRDTFGNDARYQSVKDMLDNAENKNFGNVLNSLIRNGELSKQEKEAVVWYANDLINLRGFNIGSAVAAANGVYNKPRVSGYNIKGTTIEEVDDKGNVLNKHEFSTREEMKAAHWKMLQDRANDDMMSDISVMKARPYNQWGILLDEYSAATGVPVEDIETILNKKPIDRTPSEQQLIAPLAKQLHERIYDSSMLHEEQSAEDGQDIADATDLDEPEVMSAEIADAKARFDGAKVARDKLFAQDEILKDEVLSREEQKLSPQEIVSSLETFTEEERQVVIDYYNQKAKYEGMMNRLNKRIDEEVKDRRERNTFKGSINGQKDDNGIYTISDGTNNFTLVSGNISTDSQGRITGSASGLIMGLDENGDIVQIGDASGYTVTKSPYTLDQYEESERQKLQTEVSALIPPSPQEEAPQEQQKMQEPLQQEQVQEPQQETAISRIPTDEGGNPLYEQASPEDTYDALTEQVGKQAGLIAQGQLNAATKEYEKLAKQLQKGEFKGRTVQEQIAEMQALQLAVEAAKQKMDYWQSVVDVPLKKNTEKVAEVQPQTMQPQPQVQQSSNATVEEQKQQRIVEAKAKYGDLFDDDFTKANDVYELVSMWVGRKRNLAWDDVNGKRGLQKELGWTRKIGGDTKYIETLLAKNGEGMGVDEFAHMVWESPENDVNGEKRWDDTEIKEALLELLKSAQSKSDVVDYALNSRISQAEKALQEEQKRAEEETAGKPQDTVEEEIPDGGLPFAGPTNEDFPNVVNENDNVEENNVPLQQRRETVATEQEKADFLAAVLPYAGKDALSKLDGLSEDEKYEALLTDLENYLKQSGSSIDDIDLPDNIKNIVKRELYGTEEVSNRLGQAEEETPAEQPTEGAEGARSQESTESVDDYLQPRNAEEEKIIADVTSQLQQEIGEAIKERDKAANELRKAREKESERATDLFGNDNAFNQEGQLFDNSDMPVDQSVEGVDRRTSAEREKLQIAINKLGKLQSEQERNSRIRGALDNYRRQTSIDEIDDRQKQEYDQYIKPLLYKSDEELEQLAKRKEDAVGGDLNKLAGDLEYSAIKNVQAQRELERKRDDAKYYIANILDDEDDTFVDKATLEEVDKLNSLIDEYGVDDAEGKIEDYVKRLRKKYPVENAKPNKKQEYQPKWQYNFHYDKETGRAWITRDDVSGSIPIGDGRWRIEGKSLEELRGILENPANNLGELLKEVEAQLHNAEVGEQLRKETNPVSAIEQAAESFREEQKAKEEPKETTYGADNKLISTDRYEELKKRLIKKIGGQLNSGFDPEIVAIGAEMAMYHIEAGARKFADFATRMINDIGDSVRPYLQSFYEAARRMPGMEQLRKEMDSTETVDNFDVLNYDKQDSNTVNVNKQENNETEKDVSLQQEAEETVERKAEDADKYRAFSQAVANDMLQAMETGEKPYKSIKDIRAKAKEVGLDVDDEGRNDILLQELVEDGLVSAARQYVNTYVMQQVLAGKNASDVRKSRDLFNDIVKLYNLQPSITQRSSNRIKMGQFSTPLPMSFIADVFAYKEGMEDVLEPTAGNGMMVFAIPESTIHANELDKTRLDNLKAQKFKKVTDQDATQPFDSDEQYDAVVANPPFGNAPAKEYDGKEISGLAEQIALNALSKMKDDGKAAIIIGGNMEYAPNGSIKNQKAFWTYLYDHYNVKGVIDMDGKLFSKQGTTYPTRLILIDGRRSEEERAQVKVYPPVQSMAPKKATTFEELYDIAEKIRNNKYKTNGNEVLRTSTGIALPDNGDASGNTDRSGRGGQSRQNESNERRAEREGGNGRSQTATDKGTSQNNRSRTVGVQQPGIPGLFDNEENPSKPQSQTRASEERKGDVGDVGRVQSGNISDAGTSSSGVGLTPAGNATGTTAQQPKETPKSDIQQSQPQPQKPKVVEEKRELDTEQLSYRPHNTAYSLESVAPAAMVEAMDDMLKKIEKEHGSIDAFVTKELGYDSIDDMHNALAAEQVDSVAMAIYQMKKGEGMIIGDQTGVGKGRQMAALIRWACRQGKKPVFITQKADLFSDIYRDLVDIGSGELRPFIFNSDGAMVDGNGNAVHKPLSSTAQAKVFAGEQLPDGYDFAVLTYSQVNSGDKISQEEAKTAAKDNGERYQKKKKKNGEKATPKATFLRAIANDNYLFLDESHTAAGKSNTGAYFQSILKTAKGVTFASATFAKRPDTMPMYAIRTAMSKAKVKTEELIKIIENGGVTLQEIMSRALTQAGQMVRRERDMSDVKTDWKTVDDPETVKKARENYDKTIAAFNSIIDFQRHYVGGYLDNLSAQLADISAAAGMRQGTEDLGIKNVPFASKTYNYTKQLMLALKVDAIVDEVVKEIEAGRHPVIALENTMGSLLSEYSPGDTITDTTFAASLLKGLKGVLRYTITDENGKQIQKELRPEELGQEAAEAYRQVEDLIRESTSGIFISPLDAIIEKLQAKGYKVGELTGRNEQAVLDENTGEYKVKRRTDKDKKKLARDFNSGALDVLILNKSASTGISLHASEKFSDQRQRTMIIAQPLADINDYMQMIGRIDRTGQVARGYYINLGLPVPAEGRFLMMLSTKLKSLNANTTTSQESESNDVEAPDLLNKYGSKVVVEYLRDNPDIYVKMGEPLKQDRGKVSVIDLDTYEAQEDDARKITGYVALLPTSEQDAFYNDVVRRYTELIQYLNDTGSNDLKISVLPLRARTIDKQVSSEGADPTGENPFAKDAYVEWVEMDVLKKPMKAAEIGKVIEQLNPEVENAPKAEASTAAQEKTLAGKLTSRVRRLIATVELETQAKLDKENERYEAAKARADEDIAAKEEAINAKDKLTDAQKQEAIDKYIADRRQAVEESHQNMLNKIDASHDRLMKYLKMFKVGDPVLVPDDLTIDTFMGSSHGIFCGFKAKDEGITPSTTLAVFTTLDGRRKIEVKLSDWQALNRINNMTMQNLDAAMDVTLNNWDSQIPAGTRKHGYIMTGNILQAFADAGNDGRVPGQLVTYTDINGEVHDGILMNQHWEPSQLKGSTVPIKNRMEEIKNLPNGDHIISADGQVVISRYYRYYTITVPKSKKFGAQYYDNDRLLELVDGGRFYQSRGQFQADIPAEDIEKVVNVLSDIGVQLKSENQVKFDKETEMGQATRQKLSDNPIEAIEQAADSWRRDNQKDKKESNKNKKGRNIPKDVDNSVSLRIEDDFDKAVEQELSGLSEEDRDAVMAELEEEIAILSSRPENDSDITGKKGKKQNVEGLSTIEDYYYGVIRDERRHENGARRGSNTGQQQNGSRTSNNRRDAGAPLSLSEFRVVFSRLAIRAIERERRYREARGNALRAKYGIDSRGAIPSKVVRQIFNDLNTNKALKALFDAVFDVAEQLGINYRTGNVGGYLTTGESNLYKRNITLDLDTLLRTEYTPQILAETLLHEIIHQVTNNAITLYNRGGRYRSMLTKQQQEAIKEMQDLFADAKSHPDRFYNGKDTYALEDEFEFTSEAANEKVRSDLDRRNAWQKLLDKVRQLIGKFFGWEGKKYQSEIERLDNAILAIINDFTNGQYNAVRNYDLGITDMNGVDLRTGKKVAKKVENKELLEKLESEPKEIGYRNVVLNDDGSMGSPMADKLGKKGEKKSTTPFLLNSWEQAEEHPELADENGKINLIKPDGLGTVGKVDYNPYIHIRPDKINKQFKNAWERPNLVYVEVEYPQSELNSGYKADKAKKSVGRHKWNGGELILSRWDKVTRIVPWEEVADDWVDAFKNRGVEFDIVPPKLLPILADRGIDILPPHNGMSEECNAAYERFVRQQENEKADPLKAIERSANAFKQKKAERESDIKDLESESAKDLYNEKLDTVGYVLTEAYQDSMMSLKTAQNAIAKGDDIPDSQNAYMAENLMHGKNKNEQDLYNIEHRDRIIEVVNSIMNKMGWTMAEMNKYLFTKSGLERNRELFVRDWFEKERNKSINNSGELPTRAKDIYEKMEQRIYERYEDGEISEEKRDKMLDKALQKAYNEYLDKIENDWNNLKEERYIDLLRDSSEELGMDTFTFADYLEQLDNFINANLADYEPEEHDYSGLTEIYGEEDGRYDEATIIDDLVNDETSMGNELQDKLWLEINSANEYALERYREAGMKTDEQIDRVEKMFHWYVPMRGFNKNTGEDMYQYFTSKTKANSYVGGLIKHARGRKSMAKSPLSTMFAMAYKAISDCNQNRVKQHLYRFVQAHPNDLVILSDAWAVLDERTGEWEEKAPEIPEDATDEQVREATKAYEEEMRELELEGKAQKIKGKPQFDYKPLDKKKQEEHIIDVMINGQKKYMTVVGNPRMAQALNGHTKWENGRNIFSKVNAWIKNKMSSAFTSYSPTFALRNLMRDYTHFRMMLSVREGESYAHQAFKYYVSTLPTPIHTKGNTGTVGLFKKYRNGTLDMSKEVERDFKDFMDNGGVTGYVQMKKIDELEKEINKLTSDSQKSNTFGAFLMEKLRLEKPVKMTNKAWDAIFGLVECYNEAIENNARFATYRASRHFAGRTKARSAYDAKEITVNFNRKGSGSKVYSFKSQNDNVTLAAQTAGVTSQILGEGRIFFNATVQAIATTFKNFKNPDGSYNKKYIAKWAGRYALPPFMFGLLLPYINMALASMLGSDDDDPYANLPEWTRRKNLCFYVGNESFITVPIGQELAAFLALGDMVAGITYAPDIKPVDKEWDDEMLGFMTVFSPVDLDTKVTKGGMLSKDAPIEAVGKTFSTLTPLISVASNVGWTGRPIYKEDRFPNDQYKPEYQQVYKSTNPALVGASKWFHELGGGNDRARGKEWGEVNPAIIQYLWEQYTGGPGKVFSNTISIGHDVKDLIKEGEMPDFNMRKIEGIKAFVQQGDDRTEYYRTQSKFWKYQEDAAKYKYDNDIPNLKKQAKKDPMAKMELEELEKSKDYLKMDLIDKANRSSKKEGKVGLDEQRKAIQTITDRKEKREKQKAYNEQMREIVEKLEEIDEL